MKNTINIMVDQLNSFASEVTSVTREVGVQGKLGGQADVKGVASYDPEHHRPIGELIEQVDKSMYVQKNAKGNNRK